MIISPPGAMLCFNFYFWSSSHLVLPVSFRTGHLVLVLELVSKGAMLCFSLYFWSSCHLVHPVSFRTGPLLELVI